MKSLAVYWGCYILTSQYQYELSLRETMPKLGVKLIDVEEATCCGFLLESIDKFASTYLAIRNLSLAEKISKDLLTPCNGCYLSLSEALHRWRVEESTRSKIASLLRDENLFFKGELRVYHAVNFLHDSLGLRKISEAVVNPLNNLKLATHPGCHILRPSEIVSADDPENPRKLDELVEALGAETINYPGKLDCCGGPLLSLQPEKSYLISSRKINELERIGVDGLVVSCPICFKMFDSQDVIRRVAGGKASLPVVYYTQLLGLALGFKPDTLGLNLNQSPVEKLTSKISC